MSVRPERIRPAIDTAQLSDTARAVLGLARTVDSLDALFQREREELNRESLALREADRRSPEYGTRYDAFNARAAVAERMRTDRDRARVRSREARGDLALPMLDDLESPTPVTPAAESVQARARLTGGVASLRVAPGEWWIGAVNADGALVGDARQVTVQRATSDTLRLP